MDELHEGPVVARAEPGDGVTRYVRKGWTLSRELAEGITVSAIDTGGVVEWETTTQLVRRTITFDCAPPQRLQVSLAGDVFFLRNPWVHVWRRASGVVEQLCRITPLPFYDREPSVSADGSHLAYRLSSATKEIAVVRLPDCARVGTVTSPFSRGSFSIGNSGRWVLFSEDVTVQSGSGSTDYFIDRSLAGKANLSGNASGDDASVSITRDGTAVEAVGRDSTERIEPDTR